MIFSYGFLEQTTTARQILLQLDIPEDDPLKLAKLKIANTPPAVRIFTSPSGSIDWESDFIWLMCVNEEDGLRFAVLQTVDGGQELHASWKDAVITPSFRLQDALQREQTWQVFLLRAIVLLQARIATQMAVLRDTEPAALAAVAATTCAKPTAGYQRVGMCVTLRSLEAAMLSRLDDRLQLQVRVLYHSNTLLHVYLFVNHCSVPAYWPVIARPLRSHPP